MRLCISGFSWPTRTFQQKQWLMHGPRHGPDHGSGGPTRPAAEVRGSGPSSQGHAVVIALAAIIDINIRAARLARPSTGYARHHHPQALPERGGRTRMIAALLGAPAAPRVIEIRSLNAMELRLA